MNNIFQHPHKELEAFRDDFVRKYTNSLQIENNEELEFTTSLCFLYISCCIAHKRELDPWGMPTLINLLVEFTGYVKDIKAKEFYTKS